MWSDEDDRMCVKERERAEADLKMTFVMIKMMRSKLNTLIC